MLQSLFFEKNQWCLEEDGRHCGEQEYDWKSLFSRLYLSIGIYFEKFFFFAFEKEKGEEIYWNVLLP